ncbi:MAG: TM0106 family RecB-like putative nuclease, partial [Microbacterium sp.]
MRYIPAEARVVWSASDLKAAAECEFAWLRGIDARIGRIAAVEEPEDATLERAGRLGGEHELRVLAGYRARFGEGVVEIAEARTSDAEALAEAVARTNAALASDADVIYQAAFATDEFVGFADFLARDEAGRWIVQDSKLARRARVTALMQLSAYVDQLDRLGVPRSDRVELLLGDGTTSVHIADELLPVFGLRRARLRSLIEDRHLGSGLGVPAIAWGDARGELGVLACGRCATCDAEVVTSRDLLLVAGMRPVQRDRLRTAGITTIDALASAMAAPKGMNPDTFAMLQTQARLQLSAPAGTGQSVAAGPDDTPPIPPYQVVAPTALGALPRPDTGDLFFDFEGDPLYTEGDAQVWGIDYLFGWVDIREQYSALWAHSFDEERVALETFLDFIDVHRSRHPDFHIYHYAPYEPTHLLTMAGRHGTREADVDRLLRDGVFVDLYPIVRRALRVGSRSYSIKKLEPLYMGEEVRTSDVQKGDESIVRYVGARALRDDGDETAAQEIFVDLADYNRYDCVSTRRLRDWLVDHARDAGLRPSPNPEPGENVYEPSSQALALSALSLEHPEDSADAMALRLGAAGIDYYAREAKTYWATHFLRLREPISLWEETRDVVALDHARCRLVEDWHRPEGARTDRRIVELRGEPAPGTRMSAGSNPFALYDLPAPFEFEPSPRWIHADHRVTVLEVLDDGAIVEENAVDGHTWPELPIALTPPPPPRALNQQVAIDAWADAVIAASPDLPADPATDILRRRPPRTLRQAQGPDRQAQGPDTGLPASRGDDVDAIVRALLDLDHSYLAVQGPPGTGKTYVGSHVIARLVHEHGFKVGVVAQSHAVIENMLDRIVAAGVARDLVAKAPKDAAATELSFTPIAKNGVAEFTAEHAASGYVIGGTAWDFAHEGRIPRGSLDLLVIDEAGQFSLASTIAVSLAASRLLLLGDPQQLPQVTTGTHPEPIDTSALGWLSEGHDVLPDRLGYFLEETWRMHPDLTSAVSDLSYEGRLRANPSTLERHLDGATPGLHSVPVEHYGNSVESPEECEAVVALVKSHLGMPWRDPSTGRDDAIRPSDLIVVAPYNAQV